jgi:hypothetical protein
MDPILQQQLYLVRIRLLLSVAQRLGVMFPCQSRNNTCLNHCPLMPVTRLPL